MASPPAGVLIPATMTASLAAAGPSGRPGGSLAEPASQSLQHSLTIQQSHVLIGITSMLLILCLTAVGGRLLARRLSRMRLEADDWMSVAALGCFLALCIEQFLLSNDGIKVLHTVPPDFNLIKEISKLGFASEITYSCVTSVAKFTVLLLYRRIFSLRTTWFRICWWSSFVLSIVYQVIMVSLNVSACWPVSKIWDSPESCPTDFVNVAVLGFVNMAIDLAILILPIRMVWSLQMSQKQKFAVTGVFGLGLLAVVVSLARAITIARQDFYATQKGHLTFIVWSTVEPAAAIICACLPVLRPLYSRGISKLSSRGLWSRYTSKRSRSHGLSRPSDGSTSRDPHRTNYTGTTLRSDRRSQAGEELSWLKTSESQVAVKSIDNSSNPQSPISPLDKPLPPAYSPIEGDTGYHTWTWNLLSRPRDERKVPTLTRSTMIKENGHPFKISPSPSNQEKEVPILARSTMIKENLHPFNVSPSHSSQERAPAIAKSSDFAVSQVPPLRKLETHTPILDRSPSGSNTVSPEPPYSGHRPSWRTGSPTLNSGHLVSQAQHQSAPMQVSTPPQGSSHPMSPNLMNRGENVNGVENDRVTPLQIPAGSRALSLAHPPVPQHLSTARDPSSTDSLPNSRPDSTSLSDSIQPPLLTSSRPRRANSRGHVADLALSPSNSVSRSNSSNCASNGTKSNKTQAVASTGLGVNETAKNNPSNPQPAASPPPPAVIATKVVDPAPSTTGISDPSLVSRQPDLVPIGQLPKPTGRRPAHWSPNIYPSTWQGGTPQGW